MRAFLLSAGFDVAGQCAALRSACLRERPSWVVDQMARLRKGFAWPQQHDWDPALARRLYRDADIVHLTESTAAVGKFGSRPGIVVHHHGTAYRTNRVRADRLCQSLAARQVVSTLDLMGSSGVTWLPVVVDPEPLVTLRQAYRPGHRVRIAHSPTSRELKGTDAIVETLADLPVDLDIIEGVSWAECLARKAQADIVIDQLDTGDGIGYGQSAVEAWAMGLPVISGLSDPVTRERMLDEFGGLPFVNATPTTLADAVRRLLDPAERRTWGERGREHFERFHSPAAVVERLEAVWT